jgi:methylglutaconyl-CoA hydratase
MKGSIELSFEQNLEDTRALTEMFAVMNQCSKAVIGVVQGAAIGGGVGLVAVCDYVISSAETVFSLSEVRLGIVPACIGPFVVAKIGPSYARGLFMSGLRFRAERAAQIGLVHEVVGDPSLLDAALQKVLEQILQCGPRATSNAKKLIHSLSWPEARAALSDPYEFVSRMLAELRVSEEGQEGVKAFLEKRKPRWLQGSEG